MVPELLAGRMDAGAYFTSFANSLSLHRRVSKIHSEHLLFCRLYARGGGGDQGHKLALGGTVAVVAYVGAGLTHRKATETP